MLLPYEPKGFEQLNPAYSDQARPRTWVGNDVWGLTICINTVKGMELKLSKPTSRKDLLKPEYKGEIVMPHPGSSGTGMLDVGASFGPPILHAQAYAGRNYYDASVAGYTLKRHSMVPLPPEKMISPMAEQLRSSVLMSIEDMS